MTCKEVLPEKKRRPQKKGNRSNSQGRGEGKKQTNNKTKKGNSEPRLDIGGKLLNGKMQPRGGLGKGLSGRSRETRTPATRTTTEEDYTYTTTHWKKGSME